VLHTPSTLLPHSVLLWSVCSAACCGGLPKQHTARPTPRAVKQPPPTATPPQKKKPRAAIPALPWTHINLTEKSNLYSKERLAQLAALGAQVQSAGRPKGGGGEKGQLRARPGGGQQGEGGVRQESGATHALAKRLCVWEFPLEVTHRSATETSFHVR
jgi:hypothetical protein